MPFITKLDFSDNRQVKQNIETNTVLSGATSFGVPFSQLPSGPDPLSSAITATQNGLVSTFSGNSTTTVYSWFTPIMALADSVLSAWTPSNSATTQNTGNLFSASTSTIIDGNTVNLTYTGVSFDVVPIAMVDLGGGNYSGTVNTNVFDTLSAGTTDFTGRTIWVDVSGITKTQDLIVSNTPIVGFVLTCLDTEGKVGYQPITGVTSTATTYWSASTGLNSIVIKNFGSTATGDYAVTEGYQSSADGDYSHASGFQTWVKDSYGNTEGYRTTTSGIAAHAEGWLTVASGDYSHSEGASNIVTGIAGHVEGQGNTASGAYSHAEGINTKATGATSHSEGNVTRAFGQYSHAEGNDTTASGTSSHSQNDQTVAIGFASHAEGASTTATKIGSHSGGGFTIADGNYSFVHGYNSVASGNYSIVLGQNITGTTPNYTYVESLNVKTVGSSAFVNDIRIDANGNLTTNTSDIRMKENIAPLIGSLDKIKQLNAVTYQWKDREAGGNDVKIGFIAQDVEIVEPKLVFTNKNDGYKGIHIDGMIPMLVEAVKELSSGTTTSNNVYLETQSIFAEDNNIDLNYSGTQETSVGGGIRVLHAMGQGNSAELLTDNNGNWYTNNEFKPKSLVIPVYTPLSSSDFNGNEGNITRDDNFLYVKTANGWKRSSLESF
jgi:hypothetical protein